MRSLFLERPTFLHRAPAWAKLAGLSIVGTLLFAVDDLAVLAACFAAALALFASLGREAWRGQAGLRGLAVVLALVLAFHIAMGTWLMGVQTALLFAALALLGLALTLTTRFTDLLAVVEAVLSPLRVFGLRTGRIALAFALMLRFIEVFFLHWQQLDEACRARSGRPGGLRLLAPLVLQAFGTAERVGDALSARLGR
jgi:biotin transport system permease protein